MREGMREVLIATVRRPVAVPASALGWGVQTEREVMVGPIDAFGCRALTDEVSLLGGRCLAAASLPTASETSCRHHLYLQVPPCSAGASRRLWFGETRASRAGVYVVTKS